MGGDLRHVSFELLPVHNVIAANSQFFDAAMSQLAEFVGLGAPANIIRKPCSSNL